MGTLYDLDKIARFFSGRWVEIVAGPENQTYRIHARALSESDSPSLRALVSERWDPTDDKVINWNHTDAATVERFFTYLYTGNYHIPNPESALAEKSISAIPASISDSVVVCEPNGVHPRDTALGGGASPAVDLSGEAQSGSDTHLGIQRVLIESFEIRPLTPLDTCVKVSPVDNNSKDQSSNALDGLKFPHKDYSYTKPVLAIARLYCFAAYHMSPSLQRSALERLSNIITQMDSTQPHATSELAQLTQIVYDNTTSALTGVDAMRDLISQFVATNYTSIMHDELEHVFIQGGDFAQDVARKLRRSISTQHKAHLDTLLELKEVQAKFDKRATTTVRCKKCGRSGINEWEGWPHQQ